MEKLKVVWLCHFSNAEMQSYLKPYKRVNEMAPWIPKTLEVFEGDERIELYVISPHEYIKGVNRFTLRGINYIFYNAHMPIIGRHWPGFLKWDYITSFFTNKLITKKIVEKINPDIVHLHGAENAYYSSTILPLMNKYPSILTIQGFAFKSEGNSYMLRRRIFYEEKILNKMSNAFSRYEEMTNDILKFNPHINVFFGTYLYYDRSFLKILSKIENEKVDKKFDVVFFARVAESKGIIDLLEALSILKTSKNDISLCVIGSGDIERFKQIAIDLEIADNVTWAGFQPTQTDVYKLALKAKISVLPTHFDTIPGTIIESMFLGLPVITYSVGNIPEINNKEKVILLVEKGNIQLLATKILSLLTNLPLREKHALLGKNRAYEMFVLDKEDFIERTLFAYKTSISSFNYTK